MEPEYPLSILFSDLQGVTRTRVPVITGITHYSTEQGRTAAEASYVSEEHRRGSRSQPALLLNPRLAAQLPFTGHHPWRY